MRSSDATTTPDSPAPPRRTRIAIAVATIAVLLVPAAAWAGHQFTDVSNSNIFHADIDWMRDNGVTRGCNPPSNSRYCPDDLVTREQMAAFLHRLETRDVFTSFQDVDGLLPIATFLMNEAGSIVGSATRAPVTGAVTAERDSQGEYFVRLPGVSYGLGNGRAVCTATNTATTDAVQSLSSRLWIRTRDDSGAKTDSRLSCAVYAT